MASGRFIPLSALNAKPGLAPAGVLGDEPRSNPWEDPEIGGLGNTGPGLGTGLSPNGPAATPGDLAFADIGVPGNEGGTVGTGALSGSQAAAAFGQGALQGATSQGAQGLGLPGGVGKVVGAVTGQGLKALGVPGLVPTVIDTVLGGLIKLATAAKDSEGPRGPAKTLSDNLRDLEVKAPVPDALPDPDPPEPDIPDGVVNLGPLADLNNVPLADITIGNPDAPSNPDGPGGDTGGVGGVWYHGGPVSGPPGRDKVPAHLTSGEFVVDADSSKKYRALLEMLNRWEPK